MKKIIGCILMIVCLIITVYGSYSEYNKYKIEETEPALIEVYEIEVVDAEPSTTKILDDYVEPVEIEEEVEVDPYRYSPVEMAYQTSAKTYMDYRAITDTSSTQYQFIHSDEITICEDGFLRDSEGHIGVAMGSYFGEIGSRYICYLENGETIPVIKVEAKNDAHTIEGFCGSIAYEIIEFVIDTKSNWMQNNVWENGYVFSGNFNNYEKFNGKIIKIDKVIENNS